MTKKQIIEALKQAKGVITVAAESLDCSRQAIYKRMNKDEDIAEAREQAREGMIDTAENALHNLITDPDHKDHYKAVRYYLTTQGRKRGYNDSIDITTQGDKIQGSPIIVQSQGEEPEVEWVKVFNSLIKPRSSLM